MSDVSTAIGGVGTSVAAQTANVAATLGGTGSLAGRATTLSNASGSSSSDLTAVLTAPGSATVGDVVALIDNLKTCTDTTSLGNAKDALCPAALGGYARSAARKARECPLR